MSNKFKTNFGENRGRFRHFYALENQICIMNITNFPPLQA